MKHDRWAGSPGSKRKVITVEITDKEVDALEDIFFCKLSEDQWKELSDAKHSLWKKIATAFDFEEAAGQ